MAKDNAKKLSPAEIEAMRMECGLSRQEFAEMLGVSIVTVYRWEKGDSAPRGDMCARIRDVLNGSVSEVLTEVYRDLVGFEPSERILQLIAQVEEQHLMETGKSRPVEQEPEKPASPQAAVVVPTEPAIVPKQKPASPKPKYPPLFVLRDFAAMVLEIARRAQTAKYDHLAYISSIWQQFELEQPWQLDENEFKAKLLSASRSGFFFLSCADPSDVQNQDKREASELRYIDQVVYHCVDIS